APIGFCAKASSSKMSSLVGIVSRSVSGPSGPTAALLRSPEDTPHFGGRFPLPLRRGEGTPHLARPRAETLWIGGSAAGDSPSPRRGRVRIVRRPRMTLRDFVVHPADPSIRRPRFGAKAEAGRLPVSDGPACRRFGSAVAAGRILAARRARLAPH